jgi:ATPase subunit of ABC transporter with duplicated ATPase domains
MANTKMNGEVVLRFNDVTFNYGHNHPILDEVSFALREGVKFTLMGQNGAGKSTLFSLITGDQGVEDGDIHIRKGATVAIAKQVITPAQREMTVLEYFTSAFSKKVYDMDPRIAEVLDIVHLKAPLTRVIGTFSGGQQARLLLAFALIQKPDILLLDEPTNNLDKQGIEHLTKFLVEYPKTCIVISHDANFLNAFTHGVLYLDVFTHKLEQYVGNYHDVVKEISARIERERRENARLQRDIANRKEQFNFFAQKGGHMRDVARKMREAIEELEEEVVETREEDKTINDFGIPAQEVDGMELTQGGPVVTITSVTLMSNPEKPQTKKVNLIVRRGDKVVVAGPNGIGKTTFLEALAHGKAKGATITKGVNVAYYRQDFSGLDRNMTVYKALGDVAHQGITDQQLRSTAARFFLTAQLLNNKIGSLSEGQKGLLCFARFVLQKPGLLIMDEPTNHINFRHIPVIAAALKRYEGALILVSHVPEFVEAVGVTQTLDLGAL